VKVLVATEQDDAEPVTVEALDETLVLLTLHDGREVIFDSDELRQAVDQEQVLFDREVA